MIERMTESEVASYLNCDLQQFRDRRACKVGPFPTIPRHYDLPPHKSYRLYFLRHEIEAWALKWVDWLIGHTPQVRQARREMRKALKTARRTVMR